MRSKLIEEGSHGWWDLAWGEVDWRPPYWRDRYAADREAAWNEWRERIFARWPKAHGQRPDGWWSFDLQPLLVEAWRSRRFTMKQTDGMDRVELVYHLDASAAERQQIEDGWRHKIWLAGYLNRNARRSFVRREAVRVWDVPGWYFDKLNKPANVVPIEVARGQHADAR